MGRRPHPLAVVLAVILPGLMAGLPTGCAPPIPSGGFDAPDPASRIYAAVRVAEEFGRDPRMPDRATLEHLVAMLLSADPAERLIAGDTLRLVTGKELGYDPSAPLPVRAAAVDRWAAWVRTLPPEGDPST